MRKEDEDDTDDDALFGSQTSAFDDLLFQMDLPAAGSATRPAREDGDSMFGSDLGEEWLESCLDEEAAAAAAPLYEHYLRATVVGPLQTHSKPRAFTMTHSAGTFVLQVCDEWQFAALEPATVVHIVGLRRAPSGADATVRLGGDSPLLLVTDPDTLVSGTTVSDSFACLRRSVLADRLKDPYNRNVHLLFGSMLHEIFQACLRANVWDDAFVGRHIEALVRGAAEELFCVQETEETAVAHLQAAVRPFREFAEVLRPNNRVPITDAHSGNSIGGGGGRGGVCISEVLDIEESVWSPKFGLKGKIDATVRVVDAAGGAGYVAPFELKTGKDNGNINHRAQTTLYTLMLADRRSAEVMHSLLYYCKSGQIYRLGIVPRELRALVMARNDLARYLKDRATLPPPLPSKEKEYLCSKCFVRAACDVFEGGGGGARAAWFAHWESLLTLEEKETLRARKAIWTTEPAQREALGTCFADMVARDAAEYRNVDTTRHFLKFRVTFEAARPKPQSFLRYALAAGDPVSVSTGAKFGVATGLVLEITPTAVTIGSDVNILELSFGETRAASDNTGAVAIHDARLRLFCIDKDELASGLNFVRHSLVSLLSDAADPRAERKRQLLIDLAEPQFAAAGDVQQRAPLPRNLRLNECQERAIERVVHASDYALVLGMPGTGKTTTILELLKRLVCVERKSVLLASYTHSAVDNVLLKLIDDNAEEVGKGEKIHFLRLGTPDRVHPRVRPYMPKYESADAVGAQWNAATVVATTCLGVTHPIFGYRKFDYCIIDEASQLTLPTCVPAILCADRFVLVGDHNQLPPLVRNPEAKRGGLDVSLFSVLCERHAATAVTVLRDQYRMNADIMAISNALVYDGKLRCGTEAVARASLQLSVDVKEEEELRRWWTAVLHGDAKEADDSRTNAGERDSCKRVKMETDESTSAGGVERAPPKLESPRANLATIKSEVAVGEFADKSEAAEGEFADTSEVAEGEFADKSEAAGGEIADKSEAANGKFADSANSIPISRCTGSESHCWLHALRDPERRVVFFDTDSVPARERDGTDSVQNELEATLVSQAVHTLLRCGAREEQLGVISPYRSQLRCLEFLMGATRVELSTIDRYQGRDKDCIVVSMVRSNDKNFVGELLKDWRRINVAFTRAKKKLVIFGSGSTLRGGDPLLARLMALLEGRNQIFALGAGAHHTHSFACPYSSGLALGDET